MRTGRRIGLLVIVVSVVLVFALQLQALAGGGKNQIQTERKDFAIVGTVVSADSATGCIYVTVQTGFGPIDEYIKTGAPLKLNTDGSTQISPNGLTLDDIEAGANIRASGYCYDGVFVAYVVAIAP